jgi:hypothetical protein
VLVSVHQPNFMPWLKLLDKILGSDVYVAYDTVQYTRSEYHGRQKIKREGRGDWLSVPLASSPGGPQLIQDVRIDSSQPFRARHLRLLRLAYGRAPYFDELYPLVEDVYGRDHEWLADLNLDLIRTLCDYLGSPVRIVRASSIERDLPPGRDGTRRIIDLVRAVAGTAHLTSTYGSEREYIDWSAVCDAGLRVLSQRFTHPVHPQSRGEFLPHLAAVDMLFHCGRASAELLAEQRRFDDVTAEIVGVPA